MKLTSTLKSLVLMSVLCTGLQAQQPPAIQAFDMNYVDLDMLMLVKTELENTKTILQEIQNSQNPALIKAAASSLGGVLKALAYLIGSLTLGGGAVAVGLGFMVGPENVKSILQNPFGQGAAIMALPAFVVSVIISYVFLKIIFGKLLASSEKDVHHIKESLVEIGQTINKLSYEIKKIERLMQLAKNQQPA